MCTVLLIIVAITNKPSIKNQKLKKSPLKPQPTTNATIKSRL